MAVYLHNTWKRKRKKWPMTTYVEVTTDTIKKLLSQICTSPVLCWLVHTYFWQWHTYRYKYFICSVFFGMFISHNIGYFLLYSCIVTNNSIRIAWFMYTSIHAAVHTLACILACMVTCVDDCMYFCMHGQLCAFSRVWMTECMDHCMHGCVLT